MGEDSKITFEALYEIVRNEKNKDEIQKLKPETYEQLVDYLKEKLKLYNSSKENDSISQNELNRIKTQIVSIRKLVKELYERRERKIINFAINMSRTKAEKMDTSPLLKEEISMLKDLMVPLDSYRKGILLNLVNARMPDLSGKQEEHAPEPKKPEHHNDEKKHEAEPSEKEELSSEKKEDEETMSVRFIRPVKSFLGLNAETLGPFNEGDIANLAKPISLLLIKKGYAEKIDV